MSIAFASAALLAAAPLESVPRNSEALIAACAWKKAATTSATLLAKARFDKRYVYDSEGSPTVGPLMRIRAACAEVIAMVSKGAPFAAAFGDDRKLLKMLKQTQPKQVGDDLFTMPVIRCEYRFTDAAPDSRASAVVWSYGEESGRKELSSSWETLGVTFNQQDLNAMASDKLDPSKLFEKMDRVEPVRIAALAEGKASGKPFAIDLERAAPTCRRVNADGSYTDA